MSDDVPGWLKQQRENEAREARIAHGAADKAAERLNGNPYDSRTYDHRDYEKGFNGD